MTVNIDIEDENVYYAWVDYLTDYVYTTKKTTVYNQLTPSLELLLWPDSELSLNPRKKPKSRVLDADQRIRMTDEIAEKFRAKYPDAGYPRYAYLADALFQFLMQANNPDKVILKNLPEALLIETVKETGE